MKIRAYQETGVEVAVTRRRENRDSTTVDLHLDGDMNIVSASSITRGFYIGGIERGYDVRVVLTRKDLLELMNLLDTAEVDNSDRMARLRDNLKATRNQKIVDEHMHQIKLAMRRKAYAKKKRKQSASAV